MRRDCYTLTEHNLLKDRVYHFVGIGGIGMSALARLLLEKGFLVTGSDFCENTLTKELAEKGATIFIGQRKEQVLENSVVVYR